MHRTYIRYTKKKNLHKNINKKTTDAMASKTSLSGSVIDTVIKTRNLRTMLVECHDDDTHLTFHDTPLIEIGLMSTKQGGKKA